jgi:trimeric autotransporter adhesin
MKSILLVILTVIVLTGAAFGQTSSFNYQGKLAESGATANGAYLFQFKLYDAVNGGSQVGATLNDVSVNVAEGTFSVDLNFGAGAFTGGDRFLEISVKKSAGETYTLLTPRNKINSAPYATKALNATNADNFSGALNGDVTGSQNSTVVSNVGGKSAATIATATQAVTEATSANSPNSLVKRDANGKIVVGALQFGDGTTMSTAATGNGTSLLSSQNAWTGQNTFVNGLSSNGVAITNVGNPVSATDAVNKAYVEANTIKFVPGAEQLSVGDANGTAPMINLRGGSTCCSGPGGHTPAWFKVFQNGSFVATGNLGIGVSPMQGKGYRTSWDSYKGAFRSGYADTEWDDAKVGFFSWAGGSNSTAIGLYALAFGDTNSAESTSSIVFGSGNQVKGAAGFSAGAGNRVCDTYGVALGNNAKSGGPLLADGKCDPDTFNIRGLAAVAIGYNVTASQDHTTAMGKFASNNGFSGTFIWSDGSATASADTFRNTANNEFAARATGGFRFRTNLAGTTGCNLPAGSGVFNCTSSRYTKENFLTATGVLDRLRKVPVTSWNYISEGKQVRHLGPMAEDFYAQFGLGTSNAAIGVQDLSGVSIAAVKELDEQLQQKSAEVERLKAEVESLRSNQLDLEKRLQAIEQSIKKNR